MTKRVLKNIKNAYRLCFVDVYAPAAGLTQMVSFCARVDYWLDTGQLPRSRVYPLYETFKQIQDCESMRRTTK